MKNKKKAFIDSINIWLCSIKQPRIFLFAVLFSLAGQCQAREWYAIPSASSQLLFDTNLQLRADRTLTTNGITRTVSTKDVFGGRLRAGGIIGSQDENSDIRIRGDVSFNRYTISNFNSINFYFYPETQFSVSERDKLGISGRLFLDNTLAITRPSVIDQTPQNLNETDDLLGVTKRRFLKSIRPEWIHSISENTTLNLSYEFTDVTYEDASKTGRAPYSIHNGQLNLSHQLTPKLLLFSNASATLFSTPDFNSSTTYYSLQLGGQYRFSERWEAELAIGGRYSISDFRTQRSLLVINPDGLMSRINISEKNSDSGFGSLAYMSITHHYALGRLKLSLTQDIRPTGNGVLQTSNQAAFIWTHQVSEYLDFSLPLSALRASSINSDINTLDRNYAQVSPSLRWHLSPELSLELLYRYRYQKYDNSDNAAKSHSVLLSATYNWRRFSFSR